MVGAQETEHNAGKQQTGGVTDAEAERAELEGDHADHQANDKEGAEGEQVGHLAVDGDKADTIRDGFNATRVAADLQHIALVEHHVIVDRHFDLAADNAV